MPGSTYWLFTAVVAVRGAPFTREVWCVNPSLKAGFHLRQMRYPVAMRPSGGVLTHGRQLQGPHQSHRPVCARPGFLLAGGATPQRLRGSVVCPVQSPSSSLPCVPRHGASQPAPSKPVEEGWFAEELPPPTQRAQSRSVLYDSQPYIRLPRHQARLRRSQIHTARTNRKRVARAFAH